MNLSADEALVSEARRLRLNLSRIFEERLAEAVAQAKRQAWLEENRVAIGDFNRCVEERGSYGDRHRRF